jgi:hypothetical protein
VAVQVFEGILAQVDAVEQDLPLGGIVEPRDELDDGGLALAVLADQGDALSGREVRLKFFRYRSVGARIGERDIAELEAALDGLRARAGRWAWSCTVGFISKKAIRSVRKRA